MPYRSKAQRGYMHAAAERGEISSKVVEEFDRASKGQKNLPEHVKKRKKDGARGTPLVNLRRMMEE